MTNARTLLDLLAHGALPPISGGDGSENPPNDPPKDPDKVEFDEKQQAHLNKLLADERRATEARVRQQEKDRLEAERKAAQEKKDREEAEAKGEFAKVKQSLESERDTFKTQLEALQKEHATLKEAFDKDYEKALKDLPEAITALAPEATASLSERTAWLAKARESAKKLPGANGNGTTPPPRNPGNPVPPTTQHSDQFDEEAWMNRYRNTPQLRF